MEFRLNYLFISLLLISSQCFGGKDKDYSFIKKENKELLDSINKELDKNFKKQKDIEDEYSYIYLENLKLKEKLEEQKKKNDVLSGEILLEKKNATFYKNTTIGVGSIVGVAIVGYGLYKKYFNKN